MKLEDKLKNRLDRLVSWSQRFTRIFDDSLKETEDQYFLVLKEWEEERKQKEEYFLAEEEKLKTKHDQEGNEFTRKKYLLERDSSSNQAEIKKMTEDMSHSKDQLKNELRRIGDDRVKFFASMERQKSALQDLYQDKRRQLTGTKAKLLRELQQAQANLKKNKEKATSELETLTSRYTEKISQLKDQTKSKQEGWELALETLNKEVEVLKAEKDALQKKLATVRSDNEKELETAKTAMVIAKEQLEVDKATLIEKAEEDFRACEREVNALQADIEKSDKELQDLILDKEKRSKNEEEAFEQEEKALKEAVKVESEKRDYEQKLFEQEKVQREKELTRLQEEYEKKKWYWDNQLRNLMMQRSVQEAENGAEKMKVDREARVALKSLEAKRDELKQVLSGIKSRLTSLQTHDQKESELREQRWRWRKDRLWTMWQNRLSVLKKERLVLHEQLESLEQTFTKQRNLIAGDGQSNEKKLSDIQQMVFNVSDRNKGQRRQQEIQIELEKTKLLAQIKECETMISDWKDRLKVSQEEVAKQNLSFSNQLSFLERFYKEEEQETELFLHDIKTVMSILQIKLGSLAASKDAA